MDPDKPRADGDPGGIFLHSEVRDLFGDQVQDLFGDQVQDLFGDAWTAPQSLFCILFLLNNFILFHFILLLFM